jgi:hypothetical protein
MYLSISNIFAPLDLAAVNDRLSVSETNAPFTDEENLIEIWSFGLKSSILLCWQIYTLNNL